MRSCVLYFLICCVISSIVSSKPIPLDEDDANESDEAEYDVSNVDSSNVPDRDGDEGPVGEQDHVSANREDAVSNRDDLSENEYQPSDPSDQRRLRPAESFLDRKRSSKEFQTLKRQESNKRSEINQDIQYANNHETNNYEVNNPESPNNGELNKRTAVMPTTNDEGAMLFKRQEMSKIDNKYNNNEALDSSEQAHFFKQYHNTMQTDNKRGLYDGTYDNGQFSKSRETREAILRQSRNIPNSSNNNSQNTDTVDEETAIRNHIKKLSNTELKELYDSLTDEKRQLLKKIIDDTHANFDAYDNINKREITKKAGALAENNLVENVQSELSKIQPSSSAAEESTEPSEPTSADTTTLNKQTESLETSNTNADNKEVTGTVELNQVKTENLNSLTSVTDTKNQVPNLQEATKSENKREINYNDYLNGDFPMENSKLTDNELNNENSPETLEQEYVCSQDGDMARITDDKSENQKEIYKREVYPNTIDIFSDSFKSLEESFPNSNSYGDSDSYSGPLIRVKRKDHSMKTRSAGVLPHAKTGYFQYRSESEEADNDEGNEFDDDGFYDVNSNFAKNKPVDDAPCDNSVPRQSATDSANPLPNESPVIPSNDKIARETVNLGSDTDSVISGVEGVDDNLMYSSNSRNRRNDEKLSNIEEPSSLQSTEAVDNELKTASEIYMSAPNYQENDAFGPLPRNFEGDLGRYKRIRRLKPSHDSEQEANPVSA